jgi:hypothetical protein
MIPRVEAVSRSITASATALAARRARIAPARFAGLASMLRSQATAFGTFVSLLERVTTPAQATAAGGTLRALEQAAEDAATRVTGAGGAARRRPRRGSAPTQAPAPEAEEPGFFEQYGLWIAGAVAAAVVVAVVVSRSSEPGDELAPS